MVGRAGDEGRRLRRSRRHHHRHHRRPPGRLALRPTGRRGRRRADREPDRGLHRSLHPDLAVADHQTSLKVWWEGPPPLRGSESPMKAAWRVHPLAAAFAVVAALLLSSVAEPAVAAPVPRAVVAGTARDARHPAANRQVLIPSGGVGMNALLLLAAGGGPKPTLLLLHGLPGNEQ